jgi:hypothetical protein
MEDQEQHKIKVRLAATDDLTRICEIYSQHFGHTEAPARQWWNILEDNNITYIVVEADDRVVGVSSMITINKLIRSGNRIALIEDVLDVFDHVTKHIENGVVFFHILFVDQHIHRFFKIQ